MTSEQLELVGIAEVAELAGVTKQCVHGWAKRRNKPKRRSNHTMPQPLAWLACGPIWDGAEIRAWLSTRPKFPRGSSLSPDEIYRIVRNGSEVEGALEDLTSEELIAIEDRLRREAMKDKMEANALKAYKRRKFGVTSIEDTDAETKH